MPHKEYPYYFRVGPSGESGKEVRLKATESPKVEVLVGVRPVTPAPVLKPEPTPVPTPAPIRDRRKLVYEPQINWAATRCEFDPCTIGRESRPMEDWPDLEKAKVSFVKSIRDSKYRSAPCHIIDNTQCLEDSENLSINYRMPEKYNIFMIRRFNCWPLYQVLDGITIQEPLQMVNMFCEPTPFKAWARETKHSLLDDSVGKFVFLIH